VGKATVEEVESRRGVTARAVLLGLATVACMCWLANYQLHVTGSSVLTLASFPECAMLMFVVWLVVTSVLRAVSPRWALSPGEVLTILVMSWAAGMMPARGWGGSLVGQLAAVQHYASVENRWEEIFGNLLPRHLFPHTLDLVPGARPGDWFYSGVPTGHAMPWLAWSAPLVWWGSAALAALGLAVGVSVIFQRQWVVHERLTFPLITVPMELVRVRPGERLAPIFRRRLFWVGFAVVAVPLWWNLAGYFSPSLPGIGIYKSAWELRQEIVTGFPYISFRIMPLVIGFLFLCNLDLLFSLWFFWFWGWLEAGLADTTGFSVGAVGEKLDGVALVSAHNYGALVLLVVWSIWVARRHLGAVGRAAWSRRRDLDNPGGAMSYRTALLMLAASTVYLVAFSMHAGMTLGAAVLALLFTFVAFFAVAKYMAATGMAYIMPPSLANGGLMESLVGSEWMTPRTAVGLAYLHGGAFGTSPRVFGFSMAPHALKAGEGIPGGRRILWAVAVAVVVGAAVSIWHTLFLGYDYAALKMDGYTLRYGPEGEINRMAERVERIQTHEALPADLEKIGAWGVGFGGAALLIILHVRFPWWPIHPLGLAFSASLPITSHWLSIVIAWLAKLLILKTGGVRLYERAKPFFMGLIVGYLLSLAFSYGLHEFFPGQDYKVVHDW
jgi:hypothetical protein